MGHHYGLGVWEDGKLCLAPKMVDATVKGIWPYAQAYLPPRPPACPL